MLLKPFPYFINIMSFDAIHPDFPNWKEEINGILGNNAKKLFELHK